MKTGNRKGKNVMENINGKDGKWKWKWKKIMKNVNGRGN